MELHVVVRNNDLWKEVRREMHSPGNKEALAMSVPHVLTWRTILCE